jgi:4-hydroxybenzoate polyprenyltransferase
MFSRSSWLHLRIPFSFFLLPIFLFSLSVSPNFNGPRMFWTFFIIHFLLYPASNGYNSYFDKDRGSIGGLKNPPTTTKGLYNLALFFDLAAIILGFIKLNALFAIMLLIYGLVSKAYSHPAIRLKKYAFTSLIITGLFQGLFTFIMCYAGVNDFPLENCLMPKVLIPGLLSSIMLWANYPLTQVYQHEEDSLRGDITASIKFGIRGTFYFAIGMFVIALISFFTYFKIVFTETYAWFFVLAIAPLVIYFLYWFSLVLKDERFADYDHTMKLNYVSGTCLNIFFFYLFVSSSQVYQLF